MTTEAERWENLKWVGGALALSAFAWLTLEAVKANQEVALANPKKRRKNPNRQKVMKLHHEEGLTLKEAWAEVKRKKNPKRKRRRNK